ncbi:methyltransferase domain-containing protein [Granulicella sp. 5B5]|uniref:class I SAM-dependent methyltransferase n=1 Tax=Granulicella sp. 5B5 TaxID=1617967 RepID=UPI0015F41566|nr:class I SAM-dependent methyltransferase [Granulicella sp. 5B5]QMV18271.1 methyltransferase domain-containing protein [Granulicella sp. 5B5]
MSLNAQRFTGRAEDYDRYRQRYPAEPVLMRLREWCGLTPQHRVADIGAGTGMLTEVFLANGNPVIAIEPNAEMRALCTALQTQHPSLTVVDATAEHTTLAEHSIDLVAAGRAFHWFDRDRALAEFRRILKPDGWVTLVSIGRAKDDSPQSRDFERLLIDHGTDYTYVRAGYRIHEDLHTLFTRDWHHEEIDGELAHDWDAFLGHAMSLSMTPKPDDPRFPPFLRALEDFFHRYAINDALTQPTTCWISAGRFA